MITEWRRRNETGRRAIKRLKNVHETGPSLKSLFVVTKKPFLKWNDADLVKKISTFRSGEKRIFQILTQTRGRQPRRCRCSRKRRSRSRSSSRRRRRRSSTLRPLNRSRPSSSTWSSSTTRTPRTRPSWRPRRSSRTTWTWLCRLLSTLSSWRRPCEFFSKSCR